MRPSRLVPFLFAMALSCAFAPYGVCEKEGVEWAGVMGVRHRNREREREYPRGLRRLAASFSRASQGVMRLCSIRQISIFARALASVWRMSNLAFLHLPLWRPWEGDTNGRSTSCLALPARYGRWDSRSVGDPQALRR